MKFCQKITASLALAALSFGVQAEEVVLSGGAGSSVRLDCKSQAGDQSHWHYNPAVLVRTQAEGQKPGFVLERSERANKDDWVLHAIPNGTKIYVMGLAKDWATMATHVDGIDVAKSLATGTYQNGVTNINFPYVKKGTGERFNHAMVNVIGVMPDGTHAWGGTEGTQYTVYGPHGPFLVVPKSCDPPSEDAKNAAVALENLRQ